MITPQTPNMIPLAPTKSYQCFICHAKVGLSELIRVERLLAHPVHTPNPVQLMEILESLQKPLETFTLSFLHPSTRGNLKTVNICWACYHQATNLLSLRIPPIRFDRRCCP